MAHTFHQLPAEGEPRGCPFFNNMPPNVKKKCCFSDITYWRELFPASPQYKEVSNRFQNTCVIVLGHCMRTSEARESQCAMLPQEYMWVTLPSKSKTLCGRFSNYLKRVHRLGCPKALVEKREFHLPRDRFGIQCSRDRTGHLLDQWYLCIAVARDTKCFCILTVILESLPCFPRGWVSWGFCQAEGCIYHASGVFLMLLL